MLNRVWCPRRLPRRLAYRTFFICNIDCPFFMLLRPRYFTNYVSYSEGLCPPPPPPMRAIQFMGSVSQPFIAATDQLLIYPPFLGGYLFI